MRAPCLLAAPPQRTPSVSRCAPSGRHLAGASSPHLAMRRVGSTPMTSVVPLPTLVSGPLPRAASGRLNHLPGTPRCLVQGVPCRMPATSGCRDLGWHRGRRSLALDGEREHRHASGLPSADRCLVEPDGVQQPSPAASPHDLAVSHQHRGAHALPACLGVRGFPAAHPACSAPQEGKGSATACRGDRFLRLS
jgi:hypothetical protein